jgi:hypothetical protein
MQRQRLAAARGSGRPWALGLVMACASAQGQTLPPATAAETAATPASAPAPAPDQTAAPGTSPALKLPELRDLGLSVPRQIQAASALVGMGRQRLALVVGLGTIGSHRVVDNASRDAMAVATALREDGFVVMLREDINGADLRAALKEFHERLQPGGLGLAYFSGLGAQVDGQNLLLPRDTVLDAQAPVAERLAQIGKAGVPMADVVDALMGPAGSPRLLVVDAAYRHPALADLPAPGLQAQKLPPGVMALYGQSLGQQQDVPAVAPLVSPPPSDAREIAASAFTRTLVGEMLTRRKTAPDVLRSTRRKLYDGSLGQSDLWLAGETDDEELAEAAIIDGIIPRTPEELAREAASQALRALRHQANTAAATGTSSVTTSTSTSATRLAAAAGAGAGEQSVASVLAQAANVAGAAVSAAGTVASVATTAATVAAVAKATEAAATVSVATTAVGAAGSVVGQVATAATRLLPGSSGEAAAAAGPASKATALAGTLPGTDGRTFQIPDGGERPVYNPRRNANGYAEGDTYTYQVSDTWKGEVTGRYTTAIEAVLDNGQLLADGQQTIMDAMGRLKQQRHADGSVSRYEPAQELWWSNPQRGQSRALQFTETVQRGEGQSQIEWKGSTRVGSPRKIETPAGEFEALPIESSGWAYERMAGGLNSIQWTRTVWYAPKLGHPVAIDIEDADRVGKLLKRERVELLHAQSARISP